MSNATLTVEQILDRNSKYPDTPEGRSAKVEEKEKQEYQESLERASAITMATGYGELSTPPDKTTFIDEINAARVKFIIRPVRILNERL